MCSLLPGLQASTSQRTVCNIGGNGLGYPSFFELLPKLSFVRPTVSIIWLDSRKSVYFRLQANVGRCIHSARGWIIPCLSRVFEAATNAIQIEYCQQISCSLLFLAILIICSRVMALLWHLPPGTRMSPTSYMNFCHSVDTVIQWLQLTIMSAAFSVSRSMLLLSFILCMTDTLRRPKTITYMV
jgi:hypothetical protein